MAMNNNYDLILMDLNMPMMDGFTATQRIHEYFDDLVLRRESKIFSEAIMIDSDEVLTPRRQKILAKAPYIVAISAETKTPELVQMVRKARFSDWLFTQPTNEILKTRVLMPLVSEMEQNHINNMRMYQKSMIPSNQPSCESKV